MTLRLRIAVEGVVQGVGFRPFVFGLADRYAVRGFVANRDGDVVIEAEGEVAAVRAFLADLERRAPAAARVDRVTAIDATVRGEPDFQIARSESGDRAAAIAPDIATCDACVAEILDVRARRYRYPFTSCAACGPRLTIVTKAPYDRARTTMAGFPLCAECRAEYEDPRDRRFHAQPIGCPACGPRLVMHGEDGDPIELAAAMIRSGRIVAIKGLGGYHLACDATRDDAVAELRRRKHRDAKPFAVMVADAAAAAELAELDAVGLALLESPVRPIVLAPRRPGSRLATTVAADLADVGVMLPYTPFHHLLVRALPRVPIVMTSGNVTDEPIAYRDDDALARLAPIADRFVIHDRPIQIRCDDSITRVICGAPAILRRARGYAPTPLRLRSPLDRPTLALGGHLKAAFVLGDGDLAFSSPHFGDLDHSAAYAAFVAGIAHFQALHRITPEQIVCDRHPDYATTRLAEELARSKSLPIVRVQHHHAHFASALADAGLVGPAIGVVFDGAGYGDDGTIWGGEILVGDAAGVRRAAHLRTVPQPGGDRASHEPWRMAIAHLLAAGESIAAISAAIGPRADDIAALCASSALAPPTSSVGRLFDAVAAIAGVSELASFEGQSAMLLEARARRVQDPGRYPFELVGEAPIAIDVAPMIRAIADDARRCVAPSTIARRFHTTVIELAAAACERVARLEKIYDVVLSGGVFQNTILVEGLARRLATAGLHARVHRRVPPNDGGLAFGQLAVAAARRGA